MSKQEISKQQQFYKLFESLAYTQSRNTVFEDFLDFSLLMLSWNKKAEDFKELESRWTKKEEYERFTDMLLLYCEMAEGYNDPLGDLFMEFLSNDKRGQFFTPMEICTMMAQMQINPDMPAAQTVCDPCSGSARMLLAAAKINPGLVFYAADVDKTCCKMSALNMMMNQMEGEVAWMDTLRMEHWQSWHLRKCTAPAPYENHTSVQFRITGPGETYFIERMQNTMQNKRPDNTLIIDKHNQIKLF